MTITEFLLARIAEDEAQAINVELFTMNPATGMPGNLCIKPRVLAECRAKRKIVVMHLPRLDLKMDAPVYGFAIHPCRSCGAARAIPSPCQTLCALASIYADHPDYRKEWKAL